MVGTILSNFWAALFAFSIYFFSTHPFVDPKSILLNASIIAIIVFLLTFLVRAIIAFVLKSPIEEEVLVTTLNSEEINELPSSEDLARVVKSMLNEDE
ncbi:hypothetical protein WAX74_02630 [Psychrobacillus sp. FJAT-51614]|uniref:Uncharacterized protein n=1 Tax=Psychrobacillus mangrovi TaxID=3117745 RepID=A0ABU8F2R8_9BACI